MVQGFASAGVPFTVEGQPNVTAVSPAIGPVGGTVTVSGSGFGATQSNSVLQFNGATATVSSWSDGEIVATVPPNATTGPVTVTVANLTGQSAPFTVSSTVQVTDSAGNVSNYTSHMVGGV